MMTFLLKKANNRIWVAILAIFLFYLIAGSNSLKLKMSWWICILQTVFRFASHWLMDWSGVDYCDVFNSSLDSHSDGTHSLQMIHCWASDAMLHFSKSDEETNSSTYWMPEGEQVSANFHLWENYSFKLFWVTWYWEFLTSIQSLE